MSPKRVSKALTISQPWASLIANGVKIIENRSWKSSHRGWFAVHAGKGNQYMKPSECKERGLPQGFIVAVANMTTCFHLPTVENMLASDSDDIDDVSSGGLSYYRLDELSKHEYAEGEWCYVLDDVIALPEPIQCGGSLGFWNLYEEEADAIQRQLGGVN